LTAARSQGCAELGGQRGPAAGGDPERAAVADPDDPLASQREVGDPRRVGERAGEAAMSGSSRGTGYARRVMVASGAWERG
jgi:hypothetical protein